ncbi:S-layer homology domain-containing protein [Ructibacterium gallinarum]|uniref:S-layer homology domain-containing protein n=1 Tax=Ructibacterium gallinarum TaxID=2779355 RepID=A0A9D5LZ48_9FIRM|nr:S-layer homology domain-containing protein [Ructibacterium gallinarum]MBE5040713.1 S-layer homology domain-containing protein [Ructibacterium gallinarum]
MNKSFKRWVAVTLAAVMSLGMLGVSAADDALSKDAINARTSELDALLAANKKATIAEMNAEQLYGGEETYKKALVTIDETKMWDAVEENLGVQCEYVDMYDWFYEGGVFKPEIVDQLKGMAPIPCWRIGGTASSRVNLLDTLGPVEDRGGTAPIEENMISYEPKVTVNSEIRRLGFGELVQLAYINNPETSFVPCITPWYMSEEDLRSFMAFCYDEKDESEWGRLRVEYYGIEEPIKIFYWELGNEIEYLRPYPNQKRMDWYKDVAVRLAKVIKEVNPDAKVMFCGPTAPWGIGDTYRQWVDEISYVLAPYVDAMSWHGYYDGNSQEMLLGFCKDMKSIIDENVAELDLRDENGNLKDIKISCTEHARWTSGTRLKRSSTFEAASSVMHYLNLTFQTPWWDGNNYHGVLGQTSGIDCPDWAYWIYNPEHGVFPSPIEKVYRMYHDAMGDRVIFTDWHWIEDGVEPRWNSTYGYTVDPTPNSQGIIAEKSESFSVNAMANGTDELILLLTNKNADDVIDIEFDLPHNFTLVEEMQVVAPNPLTYSYDAESAELTQYIKTEKNEPNFTSYQLRGNGLVALRLKTTEHIPQIGGDTENEVIEETVTFTEGAFADTDDSWAKNEIEIIRQAGIVCGNGDSLFHPSNDITRAEFYEMLARMLHVTGKYAGTFYEDVSADSWYADGAGVAYAEGIIRDAYFYPENKISFEEICRAVKQICINHNISGGTSDESSISEIDMSNLSESAKENVLFAIKEGYLTRLYENSSLSLDRPVTRAEAAAVVCRLYRNL